MALIDGALMDASGDLLIISRTGAGYENVDVDAATRRGVPVVYAPLNGPAAAEGTMALILALTKRLLYWHESLVRGHWDRRITQRTDDLSGKTLGIVGLGRIGREVAKRARAFGMRIVAHDPFVPQETARRLRVELISLDELLGTADVITLHAVSTPETAAMINRANLGRVKRGAYFVNFARGALVENLDILHEALVDGRLAGVALDVFPEEPPRHLDHPLFSHPRFVGSPHVLASTVGAEARCYQSMCRDIRALFRGKRPRWCVNAEVFDAPNFREPRRAHVGQARV